MTLDQMVTRPTFKSQLSPFSNLIFSTKKIPIPMAGNSFLHVAVAPPLLLLLLVLLCSPDAARSGKVSVGLYYEALCPYCANFVVKHLAPLVADDDLISVVDLHLSPWGNAKLSGDHNDTTAFTCQHGPYECLLNTVDACAIDAWPDLSAHFPFIHCVESLVSERKYPQWESCFDALGLDSNLIADCYSGSRGIELELQYASETEALVPPHQYVPWVVVDGQPLYDDYENLLSYICKAYNGTDTPKACSELLHPVKNIRSSTDALACYKEMPAETSSGISYLSIRQADEKAAS